MASADPASPPPPSTSDGRTVLISGASGLIGSALSKRLEGAGYRIVKLTHSGSGSAPQTIRWDPHDPGSLNASDLQGVDAVIHLAGENILSRWTAAKKRRIRDSRVLGARLLADRLRECDPPPKTWLSGSAIGYYGSRGEEILFETSQPGSGFLADVCREWEGAAREAAAAGIRVVLLRTGVVLSPDGGALAAMLPAFRLGMGAIVGSGRQFMSWITRDDIVGAIHYLLEHETADGPVNLVSPHPVRQADFARTLGRVLSRPVWMRAPATLIRLGVGEMADEMLLASTRVEPGVLDGIGFHFQHPDLQPALAALLGKTAD